jgi:hypothetical protein
MGSSGCCSGPVISAGSSSGYCSVLGAAPRSAFSLGPRPGVPPVSCPGSAVLLGAAPRGARAFRFAAAVPIFLRGAVRATDRILGPRPDPPSPWGRAPGCPAIRRARCRCRISPRDSVPAGASCLSEPGVSVPTNNSQVQRGLWLRFAFGYDGVYSEGLLLVGLLRVQVTLFLPEALWPVAGPLQHRSRRGAGGAGGSRCVDAGSAIPVMVCASPSAAAAAPPPLRQEPVQESGRHRSRRRAGGAWGCLRARLDRIMRRRRSSTWVSCSRTATTASAGRAVCWWARCWRRSSW